MQNGITYKTIIERKAAIERRHPATVDGTAGGEPVLFSRERLAETLRHMGPYTFAAQFLLDPAAERDQAFRDDWLRWYRHRRDAAAEPGFQIFVTDLRLDQIFQEVLRDIDVLCAFRDQAAH
jgi:hypothetical protein